jgi:hypothetical protein
MIRKTFAIALALTLVIPGAALAASTSDHHWVDPELQSYKQQIVKLMDESSVAGPITREEWQSFYHHVLDDSQLDQPIGIYHWVTMIKMGVELPPGQEDHWIDSYVYGLVPKGETNISREAAVGGLIKLLSHSIVKASWDHTEADAAKVFSDFGEISEQQSTLVRIAYRDGLLDSGVKDKFRPKDDLTNAEAISIMDKVMRKYEEAAILGTLPQGHWAVNEISVLLKKHRFSAEQLQKIAAGLAAQDFIPASLWHELLASVLALPPGKGGQEEQYTYGLAQGEFLSRDRAVAGLMKLWGPPRDATEAEKRAAAEAFDDFERAFDRSKLALAYHLGIVKGYGSSFRPEQGLSYSEALAILSRVVTIGNPSGAAGEG